MNKLHPPEHWDKAQQPIAHIRLTSVESQDIVSDPNRWVQDAIAEYITGIPKATLRRLRHEGRGPRYVKIGASVR